MQRRNLLLALAASPVVALAPARAGACEFTAATLHVVHPWTRAVHETASHAQLCMSFTEVVEDDALLAAESEVFEQAALVVDGQVVPRIEIPVGRVTQLTEDGAHVRISGFRNAIAFGRAYPLQLRFERAGLVIARFEVDFYALRPFTWLSTTRVS